MSAISPSSYSYVAQVSSYAGSLRSTSDSDAARTNAAQRAGEAQSRSLSAAGLQEATESQRSSDRDADGSYAFDGTKEGTPQSFGGSNNAESESTPADRRAARLRAFHDDYRGQLIDVQI